MLATVIKDFFLQQGVTDKKTYWIAYSGGLDSHVLLALCYSVRNIYPNLNLHAIHVNHHLSVHASQWAEHCQKICNHYAIDFLERHVQITVKKSASLEEVARVKRYAILAECLKPGDILLTAHQQNDQAETVLSQLLRGAGPQGLAAMPITKGFAKGYHARPLLNVPRAILQQYAEDQQLSWIEDESNTNTQLTRNLLRHEILPLLSKRWPAVTETIARSATHCAESQMLLEEYGIILLKELQNSDKTLSATQIRYLDGARQSLVLRTWIRMNGFRVPDTKKMAIIRQEVLMAAPDKLPCVIWDGVELRRYQDTLYLMPTSNKKILNITLTWDLTHSLVLPGIGTLSTRPVDSMGLRFDLQQVSVGFRQGGEKIRLPGRGCLTLKNLFQEWKIPPWERNQLPLLFIEEKCIGVVGYCLDEDYLATPGEMGLRPHLQPDISG